MEYKTPKVLERKPIVAGFDLKPVIILIVCALLFLFTVFTNFFISLLFPIIAGTYIYMEKKYPGNGELLKVVTYQTSIKCIHVDQDITKMVVKIQKDPELETVDAKEVTKNNDKKNILAFDQNNLITLLINKLGLANIKESNN